MAIPEETPVALEVFPRECEWSTWAFAQTLARHPRTDLAGSGFQRWRAIRTPYVVPTSRSLRKTDFPTPNQPAFPTSPRTSSWRS